MKKGGGERVRVPERRSRRREG